MDKTINRKYFHQINKQLMHIKLKKVNKNNRNKYMSLFKKQNTEK